MSESTPLMPSRRPALLTLGFMLLMMVAVASLGWRFAFQGLEIGIAESTEAANRTLTRVFVNEAWSQVKPLLPPPGSDAATAVANPNIAQIDQTVRRFSSYTDILKVKIYDRNGITVYSSDRKQIGENKGSNLGFLSAAQGTVASEMTYRGVFGAFDGEMYERNLVSTYVPVRVGDQIEGVLEIYSDRTESIDLVNRKLRSLAWQSAPWLALLLLLALAVGYGLQRKQLALARHMAEVEQDAQARAAEASAARRSSQNMGAARLPPLFDRLDLILQRLRPVVPDAATLGQSTFGLSQAVSVPSADVQEVWTTLRSIERWAHLHRQLHRVFDEAPAVSARETVTLAPLIDDVVARCQAAGGLEPYDIQVHLFPADLGSVQADAQTLRLVAEQLLAASTDAVELTGQRSTVQCKWVREGQTLRLDVVDCGYGLDPAQLEQWFTRWDSAQELPPPDGVGSIGRRLILARALCLATGGHFEARGNPGQGNRWSADWTLSPASEAGPTARH